MKLDAVTPTYRGLASHSVTLTRSTGEPVEVPCPMHVLDDGMAAIPRMELASDEEVTVDLSTWILVDLERGRNTTLKMQNTPSAHVMSQLATRYVREARELPQHELDDWVQQVVAEAQGGAA